MRVALVGLGEIGVGAHLPALLRHRSVEVAALADVSPQRRELAPPRFKVVSGLAEVLADESIRAVVLATPPWITPGLAITALRAGRFVLAEKPVATSVAAASAYQALTEAEVNRLQIGLTYRHDPALERLRDLIRQGVLGRPLLVRAHIYDERRDPADRAHTERIEATLGHGLPVVHEGAHVLDWLSYLLGAPYGIDDAWALGTDTGLPKANLCGARLSYPDGVVALVEFGWLTEALPRCEISVLGPRGHAVLDGSTFRLEMTTAHRHQVIDFPGERMTRCFDLQLSRFMDLVDGRVATPDPGLADGLAALRISERVAEAAKEVR